MESKLDRAFRIYHRDNPHVYELFKRFATQALNVRELIGTNMIIERIEAVQ